MPAPQVSRVHKADVEPPVLRVREVPSVLRVSKVHKADVEPLVLRVLSVPRVHRALLAPRAT